MVAELSPSVRPHATSALEEFSRFEPALGEVPERTYTSLFDEAGDEQPLDPAIRYAQLDLTAEDGWNQALVPVRWREDERRALAEYAMSANPGRRPQVLGALCRAARADLADFEAVARAAAAARPQTPALTRARTELGRAMATRFARNISTSYEDDHLVAVADATGTTVAALSRLAFTQLGRSARQLSLPRLLPPRVPSCHHRRPGGRRPGLRRPQRPVRGPRSVRNVLRRRRRGAADSPE